MTTHHGGENPHPTSDDDLMVPDEPGHMMTGALPPQQGTGQMPPAGLRELQLPGLQTNTQDTGPAHTTEQKLDELMRMYADLNARFSSERGRRSASMPATKGPKATKPRPFDGSPDKLEAFITGMEAYHYLKRTEFRHDDDRLVDAASNMTGQPQLWIQPYLQAWMDNNFMVDENTDDMFNSWTDYKRKLRTMYGDIDIQAKATRQIETLKMEPYKINEYTTTFQQLMVRTNLQEDLSLRRLYYNGLTEHTKNELVRVPKPTSLQDLMSKAADIDNRFQERAIEKRAGKGHVGHYTQNDSRPRAHENQTRVDKEGDVIMRNAQLTAKTEARKKKQELFKEGKCFNCHKTGHMVKNCPEERKNEYKPPNRGRFNGRGRGRGKDRGGRFSYLDNTTTGKLAMLTSNLADEEALTPEEIMARVAKGRCWICGSVRHLGEYCEANYSQVLVQDSRQAHDAIFIAATRQHGMKPEFKRNFITNIRNNNPNLPVTPSEQLLHDQGKRRSPTNPNIYEDMYENLEELVETFQLLPYSDTQKEATGESDSDDTVIIERPAQLCTTPEWYNCTRDKCIRHRNMKCKTNWWPAALGKEEKKTRKAKFHGVSRQCKDSTHIHDLSYHEKITWQECSDLQQYYKSCPFHWFQKRAIAKIDKAPGHGALALDQCLVKTCATGHHQYEGTHDDIHWQECRDDKCETHYHKKWTHYFPGELHDALSWTECDYIGTCYRHTMQKDLEVQVIPRGTIEKPDTEYNQKCTAIQAWWTCYDKQCRYHIYEKKKCYFPSREHDLLPAGQCYEPGCMAHYDFKLSKKEWPSKRNKQQGLNTRRKWNPCYTHSHIRKN